MNATAKTAAAAAISALLLASCGQNAQEASEAYKTCVSAGMAAYTDNAGNVRCQTPEDVRSQDASQEAFYRAKFACEDAGGKYVAYPRSVRYVCDKT